MANVDEALLISLGLPGVSFNDRRRSKPAAGAPKRASYTLGGSRPDAK